MRKRHIQSVSFNLMDEFELNLLRFALEKDKGSFSKYVKRLITLDIDKRSKPLQVVDNSQTSHHKQPTVDKNVLSDFL